ncbi:MAG: hypothetical protein HC888_17880 [Candidatus Competibacteraceae bacterium]|nr:hypothetical protein [Candidatus Competibacteraceae bacterium]
MSAARLESSKSFSKAFMRRHQIPTAVYEEFSNYEALDSWLRSKPRGKLVLKKSGLAAGKGVVESENPDELLRAAKGFLDGDVVLIEEFLTGFELSVFALCDGKSFKLLPACMDYKKAYEGDQGPNTGGMGAICPVPSVTPEILRRIETDIVRPTFRGMALDGLIYKGVLFFGLMITPDGPRLLEYNVRFGDPETQVLMPVLDVDFVELLAVMRDGVLDRFSLPEPARRPSASCSPPRAIPVPTTRVTQSTSRAVRPRTR